MRLTCLRQGAPALAWAELTGAAASVSRGVPLTRVHQRSLAGCPGALLRRLRVLSLFPGDGWAGSFTSALADAGPGSPYGALCRAGGATGRCLKWCAVAVSALRGLVRGARAPGGVIAQDFGFRGSSAAYKLRNFRVSELGSRAAWTIRAERARARRSGAEAGPGRSFQRTLLSIWATSAPPPRGLWEAA